MRLKHIYRLGKLSVIFSCTLGADVKSCFNSYIYIPSTNSKSYNIIIKLDLTVTKAFRQCRK
jgi:hypothetical protein